MGDEMSNTSDEFGEVLELWKVENKLPWGKLRYYSSRRNISRHTGKKKLRILDVGGGDGLDAIYFAKQGHSVTLTDCSATMLLEARMSAEKQGVSEKLKCVQTEQDSPLDNLDEQTFDLILCHMMIEFVPDPHLFFTETYKLLAAGGLISILDTNRYSDVYLRAFQMNNLPDALEAVGRKEYFHPWVNRITPRFSAQDFIDMMDEISSSLVGQYGVLNICAYLPNEPKFVPEYFNNLKELEDQLSDNYPYYLLARFFQVIGQKLELSYSSRFSSVLSSIWEADGCSYPSTHIQITPDRHGSVK
jgi:S-adenosylmethionine-dependent methyltransferase